MEDAVLTLAVEGDYVRATKLNGGEVIGKFSLPNLDRGLIDVFADWLSQNKISRRRELEVFGTLLYRAIFYGPIENIFEESLAKSQDLGQPLHFQLRFEEKGNDLANLPWEYLYRPNTASQKGFFLATHVSLALSRYMPLRPAPRLLPPVEGPLRILFVVSNSQDLAPLITEPIIEVIQRLNERYPIDFSRLEQPTIDTFMDSLNKFRPHMVHFIGHGRFNVAEGKGEIAVLDDDETKVRWIEDRDFADFFVHSHAIPRLVFLHLSEGGVIDFTANFAGLAPQLIRANIQAVVVMKYPITTRAATVFSQAFYNELAKGESVDVAVQVGRYRITINIKDGYNSHVFGTPVLYMMSRDSIIHPPDGLSSTSSVLIRRE